MYRQKKSVIMTIFLVMIIAVLGFATPSFSAPAASTPGFPFAINPADLYFGSYPNYANSPLPVGSVGSARIENGGIGYTAPVVTITDAYNTAGVVSAVVGTVTVDPAYGNITGITITSGGSGYVAPVAKITDPTGSGAMVTVMLDPASIVAGTGIRKFVDTLPPLCALGTNTLGQCLPLATPDTTSFPGSDLYRIGLNDYTEKMHTDLPPTKIRGYVELDSTLNPVAAGHHYLGPIILAQRNRPVRVIFKNMLPVSSDPNSNLPIPVDTTYMGAGVGPNATPDTTTTLGTDCSGTPTPSNCYAQNRATLHLHGGNTPWISDGTTHQWITPAGDPTNYLKGLSFQNVPDMISGSHCPPSATSACITPSDNDGLGTFYWTNQQSGRLLMYHDHAYGITRLNAYAGEAAGYLIVDPAQEDALAAATVPGTIGTAPDLLHVIPLVIQDKTFVDANTLAAQDPTWKWGSNPGNAVTGDFWFPHVYMPNQWPDNPDLSGTNAMGRWDYGPWFWPPQNPASYVLRAQPQPCTTTGGTATTCPGLPNPSGTPEAFMDTPIVNGTAYPILHVAPEAYRFQMLSIGNDRTLNLQLYQAYDPATNAVGTLAGTEVKMVPAAPGSYPAGWPTPDSRVGGWPDPATIGPSFIQIGTEGGLLPAPAVIQNRPIGYDYNRRSIVVLNVLEKALFLGPAERADVIVDFTAFAGKALIVYNDAPAPVPAFDPRTDYFTGAPDETFQGGAPSTVPGYGPNTRTIMKIVVDLPATGAPAFNLASLQAALPGIFNATQDPIIVPEKAYGAAANTYSSISATQLTYKDPGAATATPHPMKAKAIQELFTTDYGRMNATLGVELPFTNFLNQTTIPYGYLDPPTELMQDGETQIWKITHNGVDTHAIHFHLFTVQVINRVGWDGQVRPPAPNELSWKDTVIMNPLEDIVVAMKPLKQNLPWPIPDSFRPMDVTMPSGTPMAMEPFMGVDPANLPITVNNDVLNFGWEYVWHCHILGHEENDMMRAIVFQVPPPAPSTLTAVIGGTPGTVAVTFTDNSASETGYTVQRAEDALFTVNPTTFAVPASAGYGNTVQFTDNTIGSATVLYYRAQAFNDKAYNPQVYTVPQNPAATTTLLSAWSNIAMIGVPPIASISTTAMSFGAQLVGTSSAAQSVTLSNTGASALTISNIAITGANQNQFTKTTNCVSPLAINGSCTISVTFSPTAIGAMIAGLAISSNDPVNPTLNVSLSGSGVAPISGVSPAALSFGNQMLNSTSSPAKTVTLSNTGTAPLFINGITVTGANPGDFAISNNTCGASLPAPVTPATSTTCSISLTFTPGALGARSASLAISVAAPAAPQAVQLSGTGVAPIAGVSPTALLFPIQGVNVASAAQTVALSNTGTAALTVNSITVAGANAADFNQTNNCVSPLAVNGSCQISVTFTPKAAGARAATLTVTDNSNGVAGSAQTVALSGTGSAISLSTASLAFGAQVVNTTSASARVTISNDGQTPLAMAAPTITGANALEFTIFSNNCPANLNPASSCFINVRFAPTGTGAKAATLNIFNSDPTSPQQVSLSGTGISPIVVALPSSLAFSSALNVTSAAQAITVTNTGNSPLGITGVVIGGTNPGQFAQNNTCVGTLAAGASCAVNVTFRPTAANPLIKSALVNINVAAPATSQSVALTGTVVTPTFTLSPSSLTYSSGMNVTTAAQTITVNNTGNAALVINSIAIGGTNANQFARTTTTCGASLAIGASCTVDVTFRPTNPNPLTKSALLNVNVAAPATSQSVALTGTIIVPTFTALPASLAFGSQAIGAGPTAVQPVTVTNTGTVALTINTITLGGANPNQFNQTNNCVGTLAAGANCTVNVAFDPSTVGPKTAVLNVNVAAPATSHSVSLSGRGL